MFGVTNWIDSIPRTVYAVRTVKDECGNEQTEFLFYNSVGGWYWEDAVYFEPLAVTPGTSVTDR